MKKKLPQSSRCCSPLLLPCETKTLHPLHRKTEPAPLAMKGSRLCVFTSGSFAYDHFQLNDIKTTSKRHQFGSLFCTWGKKEENSPERYPHTLWFAFCSRIWGIGSTANHFVFHSCLHLRLWHSSAFYVWHSPLSSFKIRMYGFRVYSWTLTQLNGHLLMRILYHNCATRVSQIDAL